MKKILVLVLTLMLSTQAFGQSTVTILGESWENDSWGNYTRTIKTYDENNYLTHELGALWNSSSNDWDNLFQRSYINNTDGTIQECIYQLWENNYNRQNDVTQFTKTKRHIDQKKERAPRSAPII